MIGLFVILLLVSGALLYQAVGSLLGFMVMLTVAGIIGMAADAVVPGRVPYGWIGAVAAALFGAWLGTLLMGSLPPTILGIPVLPALIGALVLALVVQAVLKHRNFQNVIRLRAHHR